MIPLAGLLPSELSARLDLGPAFRGRQLFEWLHRRLVLDFAEMTSLPQAVRELLAERAALLTLRADQVVSAPDGTVKLRFLLPDGPAVDAVLLTDRTGRHTACLSTQAGCAMGCRFCRTGELGLARNLADHEIVEQLLLLRRHLQEADPGEAPDRPSGARAGARRSRAAAVDSVVFMGMGEPLANLRALRRATAVITHPAGLGMSLRRMTVSTCGLVSGIRELTQGGPHARLAVSLVSADPLRREELMPVAAANRLPDLRQALRGYQESTRKRVTLEIVLMAGVTDRQEDVDALVGFVRGSTGEPGRGSSGRAGSDGAGPPGRPGSGGSGPDRSSPGENPLRAMVNLIPWNAVRGMSYRRPSAARVEWFERRLREAGVAVAVRASRGGAVAGACGQLG